jgi:hypothetical protein
MKVVFLAPAATPRDAAVHARPGRGRRQRSTASATPPPASFPRRSSRHLTDYLQVPRLLDEDDVVERVYAWLRGREIDRVLANWEVLVLAAARLRERLGVPGMSSTRSTASATSSS